MKIHFVTGNKNKFKEAKDILKDFDVEQIEIDLPELQGEPEEIVKEKSKIAAEKSGKAVFVEDTSLCFDALNGLPGPYVKDFVKKIGIPGLAELALKYDDTSATALVCIGYCEPEKEPFVFQGRVIGSIVSPRGDQGFQWDQIFMPEGYDKTFAEMSFEEKNKTSHRKLAFEEFRKWLTKQK
ncbi:MAG: RdgB/HAM1 family non-canonical purine NTP pyrophosphatase [Nanoarchaeota archaeon]|nr:RdgB/HAM1 family non-canonical purine NTP pyrophosphatase [Nanoarchaeota archaeon]MBU1322232.1 RdgB/HAM1 family non-canonical purine NTP pyrophosphatase [Nanoarchaeota archaeon]MBU1598041.1 RdgB/HAM1 family non-canonical purine NTP pyrophosphatase [Nanoarchaeota archaeon]MBU2442046.1 RdgB/HAM1 family non-canonical purine NTP pyrophosphatase [Nanoarchaeota archaeon]